MSRLAFPASPALLVKRHPDRPGYPVMKVSIQDPAALLEIVHHALERPSQRAPMGFILVELPGREEVLLEPV
jgi:hypothetical protein